MWVLDTNTLIYFFRGEGEVAKEILARSPGDIGIPSIVLFELAVGIAKSTSPHKRLRQLEQLTSVVRTLPFGAAEARASRRRTRAESEAYRSACGSLMPTVRKRLRFPRPYTANHQWSREIRQVTCSLYGRSPVEVLPGVTRLKLSGLDGTPPV